MRADATRALRAALPLGALFVFLLLPARAGADELAGSGEDLRLHWFGTLDLFMPANAANGLQNDIQTALSQTSCSGCVGAWSVDTKAAIGGRIGAREDITRNFDVGLSVGYVAGPNSTANVILTNGSASAVVNDQRTVQFVRFLVEPTLNLPVNPNAAFHLGGGLGMAHGFVTENLTCAGNACPSSTASGSSTWNGFSWELSAYMSAGRSIFGLRYAGFPTLAGNDNNSKIAWTTTGLFAGLQF